MSNRETVVEWRVCGQQAVRGQWEGPWREGEPSRNERYDFAKYKERDARVWLEWREVTTTLLYDRQEEL